MEVVKEWRRLAENTFNSLNGRDVADLYSLEWPVVRQKLIEEHAESIAQEPRRDKRFFLTATAILLGLSTRLAPQRRIVFFVAVLAFFYAIASLAIGQLTSREAFGTVFAFSAAFLMVAALLSFEMIDKLRFRDELELARDLQADLLPKVLPAVEGFDLSVYNRIANTVGGDLYDFVVLPDGRLSVLFGDASGHGMAAGLVMAVAQAAFRTQLEIDPQPASIVGALNRILCRTGGPRSFFAAAYLLLARDGSYEAIFAGHPQMLHFSAGQPLRRIGDGAYPLGIKANVQWTVHRGEIASADVVVLHSDGLSEARSRDGSEYGYDRVEQVSARNMSLRASEIVSLIVADYQTFTDRPGCDDDVSVAVIRREPALPGTDC